MGELKNKVKNSHQRAARTRAALSGSSDRPRLCVSISNRHVNAQVIDDTVGKTLVAASSLIMKSDGTMTEKAKQVGAEIAKKAKAAKIKKVVFDRGSKQYHGRIKTLAESARENGLEF